MSPVTRVSPWAAPATPSPRPACASSTSPANLSNVNVNVVANPELSLPQFPILARLTHHVWVRRVSNTHHLLCSVAAL